MFLDLAIHCFALILPLEIGIHAMISRIHLPRHQALGIHGCANNKHLAQYTVDSTAQNGSHCDLRKLLSTTYHFIAVSPLYHTNTVVIEQYHFFYHFKGVEQSLETYLSGVFSYFSSTFSV